MTGIAYAQARMQARHGARPDARAWAALHAAITLASLLERARAGPLDSWTAGLDPAGAPQDIERVLRDRLRGRIEELARWMPSSWQPAVSWTRSLIDLPARQQALRETGDEERAAVLRGEWLAEWRRLWPDCGAEERDAIEELVHAVEAHLQRFARASPDDAPGLRLALRARVETLFRRHALGPAAAFDHLLLLALECERLRAELVARAGRRTEAAE